MSKDLLTSNNLRSDYRKPLELRSIQTEILPNPTLTTRMPNGADGYAQVRQGLTKVIATVYGFREPARRSAFGAGPMSTAASAALLSATGPMGIGGFLGSAAPSQSRGSSSGRLVDETLVRVGAFFEQWAEPTSLLGNDGNIRRTSRERSEADLAAAVKRVFDPIVMKQVAPRSALDIHLHVVEADGGVLATSINAVTLALIAAGIPMMQRVCAMSVGSYIGRNTGYASSSKVDSTTQIFDGSPSTTGAITLLDLIGLEENALPSATVAVYSDQKLACLTMDSRIGIDRFDEMIKWSLRGCGILQEAFDASIREWASAILNPVILQAENEKFPSAISRSADVKMETDD